MECLDNFKSSESILENSEDRWKIICSIAQDSGDTSKGTSSAQPTSHDGSLFLKITWLLIMTEVIIANNSYHCCYYNSYRHARCSYQNDLLYSCEESAQKRKNFCSPIWKRHKNDYNEFCPLAQIRAIDTVHSFQTECHDFLYWPILLE